MYVQYVFYLWFFLLVKLFLTKKSQCHLLRSIEYVQTDGNNSCLGDYIITCDSEYRENKHQRKFADNITKLYNRKVYTCSFVEVEYSTDSIVATELAQVVAIFTFPEIMSESQASDSQKKSSIFGYCLVEREWLQ